MPNRALLGAAALIASTTLAAASSGDLRHWRRNAGAPPPPYPYLVHPQAPGALPRLHLRRRHGSPVTPYPAALHPASPSPLPLGFTMTVERDVRPDAAAGPPGVPPAPDPGAPMDSPVNLPRDVAGQIGKCWKPANPPPGQTWEITVRLSFTAAGAVIGGPRITYVKAGPSKQDQDDLRASILDAIQACAPLRFTPALGSAIAGRMFAIRFVANYRVPSNSPSL